MPGVPFAVGGNVLTMPGGASTNAENQAEWILGTMGFWNYWSYGQFSDFVYEFPYHNETRTGIRDFDFGFRAAQHALRQVAGKWYLSDWAPALDPYEVADATPDEEFNVGI